jgi:hypothetical protein
MRAGQSSAENLFFLSGKGGDELWSGVGMVVVCNCHRARESGQIITIEYIETCIKSAVPLLDDHDITTVVNCACKPPVFSFFFPLSTRVLASSHDTTVSFLLFPLRGAGCCV